MGRAQPRHGPRAFDARRGLLAAVLLTVVLPWTSSGAALGGATATAHGSPPAGAADVLFAGCALVREGPTCEVSAGDVITLWVAAAGDERAGISLDGLELQASAREVVEDGTRYRVPLPRDRGALLVRGGTGSEFRLTLAPRVAFPELAAADRLRQSEDGLEPARARVEAVLQRASGEEASRARALLARIQLRQGDVRQASATLEQTLGEALASGRLSNAFDDAAALAFLRVTRDNDSVGARAALARVEPFLEDVPHARAAFEHYSGMAAQYRGQVSVAREHYVRALRLARRLGNASKAAHVAVSFAELEAQLGRHRAAIALVRDVLSSSDALPACTLGPLHTALGWLAMLASAELEPVVDAGAEFERALHFDRACGDPYQTRHDLLNLGLWALESSDAARAEHWLAELDALQGGHTTELAVWEAELRGSAAAARGRWRQALSHYSREAVLAEARANPDDQLRAHVARGEVLEKLGQPELALEAFGRADAAVTSSHGAPLVGIDKEGYFGGRDLAARHLIDALLRSGQTERASATAVQTFRRSIGRLSLPLRAERLEGAERELWERHVAQHRRLRAEIEQLSLTDWQLSTEQVAQRTAQRLDRGNEAERALRSAWELLEREDPSRSGELRTAPQELLLMLMPGREGWLGFSRFDGAVSVRRLPERTRDVPLAGARLWLGELRATLSQAQQLSILAYGAARSIDFAALELDGRPLVSRLPIVYRLGLEARARATDTEPGAEALIVGDPGGDLPGADLEARDVSAWLQARGDQLLTGGLASREAVLARLATASVFHYAGHGEAAREDDRAGLPLAAGERLTPGDVLALSHAPRLVVLSACDVGRSDERSLAGGWSLAHAFVMAGSEQVIAPTRPLPDAEAARLQALFYEELAGAASPSQALARAQTRAAVRGMQHWPALRAFGP